MNILYTLCTRKHGTAAVFAATLFVVVIIFALAGAAGELRAAHIDPSERVAALAQKSGFQIQNEDISKRTRHSRTFNTSTPGTYVSEFIFFSDEDPGNTTVDGYAWDNNRSSWNASRNGGGDFAGDNDLSGRVGINGGSAGNNYISRALFSFDTVSLSDDVINSAEFSVNVIRVEDDYGGAQGYINIVHPSPSLATELIAGDFKSFAGLFGYMTKGSDDDKDLTGLGTGQKTWILNTTGASWIDGNGITWLGLAEGHDIEDVEPPGGLRDNTENRIHINFSEAFGTSQDPTLVVVHTAQNSTPSGTVPAESATPAVPPTPTPSTPQNSNNGEATSAIPATPAVPAMPAPSPTVNNAAQSARFF